MIPLASPTDDAWFRVGDDRVRLLRDGAEAMPAMLAAIAAATREVLVEFYWITPDAAGERLRDALAERARAGVAVRVIYDSLGSAGLTPAWWAPLLEAGGSTVEYHPIGPFRERFRIDRLEQRDHRKLLVVDGAVGFTGGMNFGLPWLPASEGGGGWRDDVVEVRGPAVAQMRSLVYRTWRRATREPSPPGVASSPRPSGRVYVLASQRRRRRNIHREYLVRIRGARRSIDIANAYFVPDFRMRQALFGALARGVRVRVLVPATSDVPAVQFAIEALFDKLLRNGGELYALPGPMLHSKTIVVDEGYVMIGSYNLDERSWRKNLEANVAVVDDAFARHVTASFERDLALATRIDRDVWQQRSLARRGAEWLALALRELW